MQIVSTSTEPGQPQRLLRFKAVGELTGLSRSEIYRLIGLGRFPRSIPLGDRIRAFPADEIYAWIESRIAERAPQ